MLAGVRAFQLLALCTLARPDLVPRTPNTLEVIGELTADELAGVTVSSSTFGSLRSRGDGHSQVPICFLSLVNLLHIAFSVRSHRRGDVIPPRC
jgi:hypothetical protein